MGNRAVITFAPEGATGVGVYVHWNGGRESVRAFLDTCRARGYRCPQSDPSYAMAGLVAVIREFFGPNGLSVGVDLINRLDCENSDNGVYQVGAQWEIVGRWGKGSNTLAATVAPLSGRAQDNYAGIMAKLAAAGASPLASPLASQQVNFTMEKK